MSSFITRVELHGATADEYETLHESMEREGFARVIQGSNGIWYQLPTAEYHRTTNLGAEAVRESARRAANTTGRTSDVLVTQAASIVWHLQPIHSHSR